MNTCFPDIYTFERVTVHKIKFDHWEVRIDGTAITLQEIRARVSQFQRNDDNDPLNTEFVRVMLRHQLTNTDLNFDCWLSKLGFLHKPSGDHQDTNGQYLCVYLSDFIKVSDIDIAVLLGWVTRSSNNYGRMIKHRKKAFFDNLSESYKSLAKNGQDESTSSLNAGPSLAVQALIKKELSAELSVGFLTTKQLVDECINKTMPIDDRVATRVKRASKKATQEALSHFIEDVLYQIENNPV